MICLFAVGTNGNVPPFVPYSSDRPCPSFKVLHTNEDYRTPRCTIARSGVEYIRVYNKKCRRRFQRSVKPQAQQSVCVRTHSFLCQNPHSLGSEPTPFVSEPTPASTYDRPRTVKHENSQGKRGFSGGGFPHFKAVNLAAESFGQDLELTRVVHRPLWGAAESGGTYSGHGFDFLLFGRSKTFKDGDKLFTAVFAIGEALTLSVAFKGVPLHRSCLRRLPGFESGQVLAETSQGLNLESCLCRLCQSEIDKTWSLLHADLSQKLLGRLHVL
jgi:hypothetical protein